MKCNGLRFGVVLLLGLAAAASAGAQDEDCKKNHYILDTPVCDTRAIDVPTLYAGVIATGSVAADAMARPSPRLHKSLRHHGLSMPYFSFSSSIGG